MGIKANSSGSNIGDIKPHASAVIPAGWLECGGQAVSRTDYAALFLAIGVVYGAGNGSTTFNLPDLRGRTLFGKDNLGGAAANRLTTGNGGVNGAALGAVGGGEAVTLTAAQMPNHEHGGGYAPTVNLSSGGISAYGGGGSTGGAGSSGAHPNIPPAMVVNYIIKT